VTISSSRCAATITVDTDKTFSCEFPNVPY
jgi:hypothetical protein